MYAYTFQIWIKHEYTKRKWNKKQSNENKFSFQNIDSDVRFIKDLIWKTYPRQDVLGIKRKKVDQKCSKYWKVLSLLC